MTLSRQGKVEGGRKKGRGNKEGGMVGRGKANNSGCTWHACRWVVVIAYSSPHFQNDECVQSCRTIDLGRLSHQYKNHMSQSKGSAG